MIVRLAIVGVLVTGLDARADLRTAFGNDTFSELAPPYDDDGFTNDIDVWFWRPHDDDLVGGRIFDRWLTEVPREAGRRRDLLELTATGERTWGEPRVRELGLATRVGPVFTGNLGGRWGQNAFHTICHCGSLLDEGLQRRYEHGRDAGVLAGATARGSLGVPAAQMYGVLDGQLALGTGVDFVDAAGGVRFAWRSGGTEIGVHLELAVMRFHVVDPDLGIPGGYRPGWQTAVRPGFHVSHGRVRIDYEYRANEGGSGEPIGVVAVTIKQAGTSF